jgi:hypothetical protein
MTSISYVDSKMSNSLNMIAHFAERRQRMPMDTCQFEPNLCDAVGCSTFHIVVVGSILNGITK